MITTLRRLFWLGALGGGGYAAYTTWRRRNAPDLAPAPEWPPLEPRPTGAAVPHLADTGGDASAIAPDTSTIDTSTIDTGTSDDEGGTVEDPPPAFPAPILWMPPIDGACPEGYPIKANDNSGIYHVPGGTSYQRTIPERCYANSDAAEADGYRAVKG